MDRILIKELAVNFQVGVPDSERERPQRLLLNIELFSDFTKCAASDDISQTINYFDVVQDVKGFGSKREWKLIEKLAEDLAAMLLRKYRPTKVAVEVRKFIVPDCRYISVSVERP